MTMTRRIVLAAAAMAAGLGVAQAQEPIRIGAINPYSGPLAQYGDEATRGFELGVEAINAAGGIGGRKLVIVRGDAGNPQQGIAAVEKLVSQDKVDLFMGTYISAVANAASDAAARHEKIYFEAMALASDLTERGLPNFVRGGPNATHFAERSVQAMVEFIAPKLNKKPGDLKVWIEHEDTIYGTSIAQVQKRLLEAAGAKVVGVGSHNFRAIDLNDAILRASNAQPDIWVGTGYVPDNTLLLRTMRDQGFKPPVAMLLGTGDSADFREALGDFMDGVFVVGYPHADLSEAFAPGAAAFVQTYKAKYNRDPVAPQSLSAFTEMMILRDLLTAAGGPEMQKVRAAAAAIDKPLKTYTNGYGVKFDAKMQNQRAIPNMVQWQGGKTVTVFPTDAAMAGTTLVNLPRAK